MAHEMIALVQQDPNVAQESAQLLHGAGYATHAWTTRAMPIVLTSQDTPFFETSYTRLQAQSVPAIWTHARPFDQAALLHALEHALQQR